MTKINVSDIKPGMHLRVFQKIKEGDKERTQQIEGIVLSRKHGQEPGATFTLRKVIDGVGVEWIIPIHLPSLQKIELIKAARVRRAKLYYLRNKSAKQVRKKLKILAKELAPEEKETTS
ncbi:MAG: 50S ribosomal protein L19 [Parcubacteria group bacterium]|nr:50S ribosomal protein L19 [Parcubacteria group bacterium]